MPRGVGSLQTAAARRRRYTLGQALEGIRALLFLMLGAAARYLPRSWAYAMADSVRTLLSLSPIGGRAREVMRAAFPAERTRADAFAADWLGGPFRDHVNAVRVATGREQVRNWTVELRNPPAFLCQPGQSFIIATGHFSREAMTALYVPWLLRCRVATVVAPMNRARDARGARIRAQMRAIRKGVEVLREGDIDIADVAGTAFLVRLLHHLREPGGAVIIASDAAWGGDRASHVRPFAASAAQPFAFGTARLARMSQRPIVTCVPFMVGDRRVVLEWGPAIAPPARNDASVDVRITNEILDWIEERVGKHPGQYLPSLGCDRHWSPAARRWVDRDHLEASNDSARLPHTDRVRSAKSVN